MLKGLRQDIDAIRERDPAARNSLEVLLLYSGLHALILHRPAHWLYRQKCYFPARLLSQFSRFLTGIEIHPGAKIGRGVLIDHGSGVVIGETAEVGDNCTIYQGVTLGGTGKDSGKRHPTLGRNVLVGSGAKILGPFKIGDGSKIASNAVVLQPTPPGATAVGVPARIVKVNGKKVQGKSLPGKDLPDKRGAGKRQQDMVRKQLDHVHIPDPVSQELCRLAAELNRMKKRMDQMEGAENSGQTKQQENTTIKETAQ